MLRKARQIPIRLSVKKAREKQGKFDIRYFLPSPTKCLNGGMSWNRKGVEAYTHGGYETRYAIRCPSGTDLTVSPYDLGSTEMHLAFCPADPTAPVRDLMVFLDGRKHARLKGALQKDQWTDLRLSNIQAEVRTIKVTFEGGGHVDVADPKFPLPTRTGKMNILTLVTDNVHAPDLLAFVSNDAEQGKFPNIEKFFKGGYLFTNAFAQGNWTLPSLASMATGLYASGHGVFNPYRFSRQIPQSLTTIAERFQADGYRTMAFSTNGRFSPSYGHHRGYDRFLFTPACDCVTITDAGLQFMEAHRDEPFFCLLHYFDTHYPFEKQQYLTHHTLPKYRWAHPSEAYLAYKEKADPEALNDFQTFQEAKMRDLDLSMGTIFSYLERTGRMDDTTVVLIADHAYGLRRQPVPMMRDNVAHVPLMIRVPGKAGRIDESLVEASVDYFPTVLKLASLDIPPHAVGRDLLGDEGERKALVRSECIFDGEYEMTLRDADWSYSLICRVDMKTGEVFTGEVFGEYMFTRQGDCTSTPTSDTTQNLIHDEKDTARRFREAALAAINDTKRHFGDACHFRQPHWQPHWGK